jgi:hypothetical protein
VDFSSDPRDLLRGCGVRGGGKVEPNTKHQTLVTIERRSRGQRIEYGKWKSRKVVVV